MAYRLSPPTLDIILAPLAEKKRQKERENVEKGPYRDRNRKRHTGGVQTEREGEVEQGGNTERGKDTERKKKYGDKQQCC